MSFVQIRHMETRIGGKVLVKDSSFAMEKGEILCVLGSSGAGKTTLLRTIAGLEKANAGSVTIDGKDVTNVMPQKRGVGMVFQQPLLFPQLTVGENIAYAYRDRKKSIRSVEEWLKIVGLEEMQHALPNTLSGGQQQRVAFVRSLAAAPSLLLFDEPFSALDPTTRRDLRVWLRTFLKDHGVTALFVTHDIEEGSIVGDRIMWMEDGEIVQIGTPEQIKKAPAHEKVVRSFIDGIVLPGGRFLRQQSLSWTVNTDYPTENRLEGKIVKVSENDGVLVALVHLYHHGTSVTLSIPSGVEGQEGYVTFSDAAVEYYKGADGR